MSETRQLLLAYVKEGSEPAFKELVSRYLDLVYSTAVRLTGGDMHLAQDVAQTVFVQLARNAPKLAGDSALGGWLHRTTCNAASKMLRGEQRRLRREKEAMLMNAQDSRDDAGLEQLRPVLDEAINQLGEADRSAIVLRFFEQRDFHSVGEAMGSNEDAARMRVNRALDKLQEILRRKGVTCSAAALGTLLGAHAVTAAPAGLAVAVSGAALAGAASGVASTATTLFTIMSSFKTGVAGAILVTGLAGTLVMQHRSAGQLRAENDALRNQVKQREEQSKLSQAGKQAPADEFSSADRTELLRLRGEVGLLRQDLAEGKRRQKELQDATQRYAAELGQEKVQEKEREAAMIHAGHAKHWLLAFYMYSAENHGRYPATFDQATPFLPAEFDAAALMLATNDFEIFPIEDRNAIDRGKTIALRGRARPLASGAWQRAYGMADGSAQTVVAPNGDFAAAEARYGFVYPPKPGP